MTRRIGYGDVKSDDFLTVEAALNYMQDCGAFQLEDDGRGYDYFKSRGTAVFIIAWQIDVTDDMPRMGETVSVDTWIYGYEAFYCYRNYLITADGGRPFVKARAVGAFVDTETGRPSRISDDVMSAFVLEEKLDMEYLPRKIRVPKSESVRYPSLPVMKHYLDKNRHMNNCKYFAAAEECLPDDFKIKRFRAEYRKPAVYGDVLFPEAFPVSAESVVITLADAEGRPYALTEFERL